MILLERGLGPSGNGTKRELMCRFLRVTPVTALPTGHGRLGRLAKITRALTPPVVNCCKIG